MAAFCSIDRRATASVSRLLVLVSAGASCGSRQVAQPAPAASPSSSVAPGSLVLRELEGPIDPRATPLMRWVVPLMRSREGEIECSSTMIGSQALLTAAHCVDGAAPPMLHFDQGAESLVSIDDPRFRACRHGGQETCEDPFPDEQREFFRQDIATLWVDPPQDAMTSMGNFPQLTFITGRLPGAYILSRRHGRPRAVCRTEATDEVGMGEGRVEKGDSGSAVVALREDGTASILGVVSHFDEAGRWYFAMLPVPLPWPAGATAERPPIEWSYDGAFSAIEDCP